MRMIITPKEYWNNALPEAMMRTGYIPEQFYYLITTSKDLIPYINEQVIKNWYAEGDHLVQTLKEILYVYDIDDNYFDQTNNVSNLENVINKVYTITIIDTETAYLDWEE